MFDWWTLVSIYFDLRLPLLAAKILFCFSNHHGVVFFFFLFFHFHSIASWRIQFLLRIWPVQLVFLFRILFISVLFSPIRLRTLSLVTFSDCFIFSILLQHNSLKLSKYFRSDFHSVQVFEPYISMLQIINFFPSSMFSLLVNSDIFLLNASLAVAILILISFVQ